MCTVCVTADPVHRACGDRCAAVLGIKYREGFIKNRYVGRTFIMPAQVTNRNPNPKPKPTLTLTLSIMPAQGLRKKSVRPSPPSP